MTEWPVFVEQIDDLITNKQVLAAKTRQKETTDQLFTQEIDTSVTILLFSKLWQKVKFLKENPRFKPSLYKRNLRSKTNSAHAFRSARIPGRWHNYVTGRMTLWKQHLHASPACHNFEKLENFSVQGNFWLILFNVILFQNLCVFAVSSQFKWNGFCVSL